MKNQNQLFKIFTFLIMFAFCFSTFSLNAQSDEQKTMTIKIVAVDQDGNQTTQTIVKTGEEVVEENIQAEIDALLEEMQQGNAQLEIDVNVEIEDGSGADGNEMVGEEKTITIDMSGDETQMMIIDTDSGELDAETRKKLEEALEGSDIDLDELLKGNIEEGNGQRRMRIMKKQMDAPANKAFLGVYVNANTNGGETVAIISDIVKDSAAEKAGLKAGDRINTIDGAGISDFNTLVKVLSQYEPGDIVKISYTRDGDTQITEATLTGPKESTSNVWIGKDGKAHDLKGRKHKFKQGKSSSCNPNDPSTWPAGCCEGQNKPACCAEKSGNQKARLGVYLDEGDFDGAKVSDIVPGSDAEKAGIQNGVIIKKVGKTKIKSADDLIDAIQTYKIGDEAKIQWVNGDSKTKKKVTFTKPIRKSRGCCSGGAPQNRITEKIIIRKKKLDNGEEIVEQVIEDNNPSSFLNLNSIDIFPNPTDGIITVKFAINNQEATTIELVDVTGRAIFSEINPDFDGNYSKEIDLSGNPEGVYILRISQNDKIFTEKIIFNKQ